MSTIHQRNDPQSEYYVDADFLGVGFQIYNYYQYKHDPRTVDIVDRMLSAGRDADLDAILAAYFDEGGRICVVGRIGSSIITVREFLWWARWYCHDDVMATNTVYDNFINDAVPVLRRDNQHVAIFRNKAEEKWRSFRDPLPAYGEVLARFGLTPAPHTVPRR